MDRDEHPNGDIRVLVVDDDEALLRMVRLTLSSAGCLVTTAGSGIEGLDRLDEDDDYDVIVLDLQMPRMDGRSFYHEMRERGHRPEVVVLSAYGAQEARRELGASAAVSKPFDPDYLVETVRRVGGSRQPA
jgi:two-component system alkaline phosphatase synthesis response regulator PhoP